MVICSFTSNDVLKGIDLLSNSQPFHDNIVIHSSLSSFGYLINSDVKSIVNSLIDNYSSSKTLFFPTFSYSFRRNRSYDSNIIEDTIRSEMGELSFNAALSNLGQRTKCPLYSYYVIGKNANLYSERNSKHCFDENSLFGKLFKEKTCFIGLGCGYSNGMSPFMHLEYMAKVPFRVDLPLKGMIYDHLNKKNYEDIAIHFARDEVRYPKLITNHREEFGLLMEKNNISFATEINNKKIYSLYSESFYSYVVDYLIKDPFVMTKEGYQN